MMLNEIKYTKTIKICKLLNQIKIAITKTALFDGLKQNRSGDTACRPEGSEGMMI